MNTAVNQNGEPAGGDLVARVPKEHLKSLFYLFSGKPDSRIKTFNDAIHISKQDILELHDCISAKLATHDIDAVIATVKIGYEGSQLSEFGTWAEFSEHNFVEPERIEEIVVKWDFLVNVREFANPQRHTLLFRVSCEMKPSQLFHMLRAGNHDELDQVDVMSCPAFCRVDFINAHISKELINVVSDWYSGRKEPELIEPFLYKIKKKKSLVVVFFDQWLIFSWAMLVSSFLYWKFSDYYSGNPPVGLSIIVLFISIYSLRPASRISGILVGRVYKAISEMEGSRVVFEFTSGDRKRISQQKKDNRKNGVRFILASSWNVALNIIATIICAYFVSKGMH